MISVLQSVGLFFKYSPKRQRQFEQAVERHTANSVDVRTVRSDDNNRHAEASDDDAVESDEDISNCENTDNVACESNHDQSHSESPSDSQMMQNFKKNRKKTLKRKIKPLCETRWIERHTALTDFSDLYIPLLDCLKITGRGERRGKEEKEGRRGKLSLIHI